MRPAEANSESSESLVIRNSLASSLTMAAPFALASLLMFWKYGVPDSLLMPMIGLPLVVLHHRRTLVLGNTTVELLRAGLVDRNDRIMRRDSVLVVERRPFPSSGLVIKSADRSIFAPVGFNGRHLISDETLEAVRRWAGLDSQQILDG